MAKQYAYFGVDVREFCVKARGQNFIRTSANWPQARRPVGRFAQLIVMQAGSGELSGHHPRSRELSHAG